MNRKPQHNNWDGVETLLCIVAGVVLAALAQGGVI